MPHSIRRCRRQWAWFPLGLLLAGIALPIHCFADTIAVPEFNLYVTHNHMFRSRLVTNASWSKKESEFTNAAFEYDLDLGLLSFFRRYVFKDPNPEKSRRLTFRVGYAYLPEITTGNDDLDEKRMLAEATLRFPLGNLWLLTDRNRGELRDVNNKESGRYRNRLRLERNVAMGKFRMTPYANAEAYYDGRVDDWNQADAAVGAEFPWYYSTILEFSFTHQFKKSAEDNQVIGLTLQKHL